MKIGWQPYSTALGYGWYGDFTQAVTAYDPSGPNPLQGSILYDDFGRIKTFEFDLPNGTYDVTVSVGWPDRTDLHTKVVIEGIPFVSDEASSPFLVRTFPVTVNDHKLSLEMGVTGEYTLLTTSTSWSPTATPTGFRTPTRSSTPASARASPMRGWIPTTTG